MSDSRHTVKKGAEVEGRLCRSLIANSFDVFKIVDRDGVIRFASPSVQRVMGFRPDELVGTTVFDWVHPDDIDAARTAFAEVLRRGELPEYLEIRDRHRDGSYRIIEVAARNLLGDPAVDGVVLNYRDVTDRREWERALRQSEDRYQRAFHSSPDSITISSLDDGTFLEVNEGFERITGYTRDEIIGRTSLELGVWKNPSVRDEIAERLRRDGVVRGYETVFCGRDGVEVVGRLSATVIDLRGRMCMLATVRDVTGQKEAEEKLREATAQLKSEHKELSEKHIALTRVLEHIEEDKTTYRHDLASRVEDLIRPVIARLRSPRGRLSAGEIETLKTNLGEIIQKDINEFENNRAKLTPRELDICELIKTGRTSKEIAEELGLSPETIHKHRQSIRRKLQIDHRGVNLSSYLRSR